MNSHTPSTPADWTRFEKALLALRDRLLRERNEHEAALRLPLARGGTDVVDVANNKVESTTLCAEIAHEDAELAEVEAALERIRRGTYGICEATGTPITLERLQAIPWTRFSIHAAALREKTAGSG